MADEGVEKAVVDRLRVEGHQVDYVAEFAPSTRDENVLSIANEKRAVLITSDKDFGELVYRRQLVSSGVVLLRLSGLSETSKADLVSIVVTDHGHELDGAFTVVEPGLIRIRPRGDFR